MALTFHSAAYQVQFSTGTAGWSALQTRNLNMAGSLPGLQCHIISTSGARDCPCTMQSSQMQLLQMLCLISGLSIKKGHSHQCKWVMPHHLHCRAPAHALLPAVDAGLLHRSKCIFEWFHNVPWSSCAQLHQFFRFQTYIYGPDMHFQQWQTHLKQPQHA